MKPTIVMRRDTFKRDIFNVMEKNGIDTTYIAVYTNPASHTVTLATGYNPWVARQRAALSVLRRSQKYTREYFYNGRLTTCIIGGDGDRKRMGSSYCSPEDGYDRDVGKAIAFERALYGKVVTLDLLIENCK